MNGGFARILQTLAEANVNFILVGGYACIAHGSQSRTDDLDICYQRSPQNLKRLAEALAGLHARLRGVPSDVKAAFDERSLLQGTNFTLITNEGPLDLLAELSAVGGYNEIVGNAVTIQFGGIACPVASLDDIIRSKQGADRPKDRERLPELRALKLLNEAARRR